MNLPVIFSKALTAAKSAFGKGWVFASKHAPEIMIGTGIAGFGATVWQTVKATNKTNDIFADKERRIELCNKQLDEANEFGDSKYNIEDYDEDVRFINRHAKWRIVKAWTPVATLGAGSVIFVLGGYKILNGRYVATAAAYKILEAEYGRYRENAIDKYGEEADRELLYGVKAEQLEAARKERDDNDRTAKENKKKIRKKKPATAYSEIHSKIFDPHSERWQRYWTAELVMDFLGLTVKKLQDRLDLTGHLFENEINDALGLPRTPEGQVCGYIRTKENPFPKVDIGLEEMPESEVRRILGTYRNEDIYVKLHYNGMKLIYNMI